MQQNYFSGDPLSLERIRSTLIRLEDTIIFALIERAQFAHNPRIYEPGGVKELREVNGLGGESWLEWFLREMESFQAKARRYTSPDEYPFTPASALPRPLLPPLKYPALLHPNSINANSKILSLYIRAIVPRMTRSAAGTRQRVQGPLLSLSPGGAGEYESKDKAKPEGEDDDDDDGNYGSAATLDVETLQAISKRVHYGKFVSESKFRADPAAFVQHIQKGDREKLGELITKPEVERRLLARVRNKARLYGQEVDFDGKPLLVDGNGNGQGKGEEGPWKIDVEGVVELYERYIIPLTKEVEVDYLLQRLDGLSDTQITELAQPKQSK